MDNEAKIKELEAKIERYKLLCRLGNVPEFLVENPIFSIPKITEEDKEWGREALLELAKHQQSKQ